MNDGDRSWIFRQSVLSPVSKARHLREQGASYSLLLPGFVADTLSWHGLVGAMRCGATSAVSGLGVVGRSCWAAPLGVRAWGIHPPRRNAQGHGAPCDVFFISGRLINEPVRVNRPRNTARVLAGSPSAAAVPALVAAWRADPARTLLALGAFTLSIAISAALIAAIPAILASLCCGVACLA